MTNSLKKAVGVILIFCTLFLLGCKNNATVVENNESSIKNSEQTNPSTNSSNNKINLNDIKTRAIEDIDILRDKLSKADDTNSINNILKEYYESNRDKVSFVYFANESGEFYLNPNEILPEGYDARKRTWYVEAIKNTNFISEQYQDIVSGNNIITFAKVVSKNNMNFGVVGIDRIVK